MNYDRCTVITSENGEHVLCPEKAWASIRMRDYANEESLPVALCWSHWFGIFMGQPKTEVVE